MKLIDLSRSIEEGIPSDPPHHIPKFEHETHEMGVARMLKTFPGCKAEDLPNGLAWASETITLNTHTGTHLDAPCHYAPTMNKGERAASIDEIPLEWCYGDAVKFDFSHRAHGELLKARDFQEALDKMEYTLKPMDIVLVQSGAAPFWGRAEYKDAGCGMGREATLWLLEQGVRVTGTDAWSWDRPFCYTQKYIQETGDMSAIWEGHFAGIEIGYCHMEKICNLELLPSHGFKVACFPVKVKGGTAGWVRPVAFLED